jgi:hypothetical protein
MSTGGVERKFQEIELDERAAELRKKAAEAKAERVKKWKRLWGFVDDTLVGTGPKKPLTSRKGSQDDTMLPTKSTQGPDEIGPELRKLPEPSEQEKKIQEDFERQLAVLRGRYAAERTAAIDQITGTFYSEYRRGILEELTGGTDGGPYYLTSEYGMRTAKDEAAERKAGIRISHDKSSVYLRDAPGKAKGLFEELYKSKHGGNPLPLNGFIVNSPKVVEKLTTFYGADLFLTTKCNTEGCTKKGTPYPANTATCPTCTGAVSENPPREEELAPGICTLVCDFNSEKAKGYFEQPDPQASMRMLLQSVGATPSSYQAFKALHGEDGKVPLAEKPLDNGTALKNLATSPGVATLKGLPPTHPMANITGSALAMVRGLGKLPLGNTDKETKYPADPGAKYQARHKALAPKVKMAQETEGIKELRVPLGAVVESWEAAERLAKTDPVDFAGANEQLDAVEEYLPAVLQGRFERDPVVQNSLQNLERILAAMPNYKDDPGRFTGLYDLMIDELYLVLARTCPYQEDNFKGAALDSLSRRAPVLSEITANKETYLVASGMDALSTGFVAAMKAQGGNKPEVMDFDVDNANYFEVKEVLKHAEAVQEHGQVIVATLNPSTPLDSQVQKGDTPPPSRVDKILERVREKLGTLEEGQTVSMVLDATIETKTGGTDTESELNRLLSALKGPINEGKLNLVLCKSYQKYPSLGTGKVMAGNVTVISKDGNFAQGTGFIQETESALDFANNDESQLMTHMLTEAADFELHLMERAGKNANFLETKCGGPGGWGTYNKGLPFLLTPNKKVLDVLVKMGVERRDSFGFQNSSCLDIPQGIRINPGQESEEVLTEKFYAVGHFLANRDEKSPATFREVGEHMDGLKDDNNATASCLAFSSVALELTPEEQTALHKRYEDFIKGGMAGVSDPMKTQLLTNYVNKVGESLKPLPPAPPASDIPEELPGEVQAELANFANPAPSDFAGLQKAVHDLWAAIQALDGATYAPAKELAAHINKSQELVTSVGNWVQRHKGWEFDRQSFPRMAAAREQLLQEYPKAEQRLRERLREVAAARRPLDEMTSAADKFPHKEDRARLLTSGLSADTFSALPPEGRARLTEKLYNGLDLRSKLAVFDQLVNDGDVFKAEACLGNLEKTIEDVTVFGKGDVMDVQTLSSGSAPGQFTEEEITKLRQAMKVLKEKYETQKALWQGPQEWKIRQDFDRAKDLQARFDIVTGLLAKPDLAKAAMFLKKLQGSVAELKDSERTLKGAYDGLVNRFQSLQEQERIKTVLPNLATLLDRVGTVKAQMFPGNDKGQAALETVVAAFQRFVLDLGNGTLDADLDPVSSANGILAALGGFAGTHPEQVKYIRGLVEARVNELITARQAELKERAAQSDPLGWLKELRGNKFWDAKKWGTLAEAVEKAGEGELAEQIRLLKEAIDSKGNGFQKKNLLPLFPK